MPEPVGKGGGTMKNKTALVLMEQAIMLLVFALAAALCLQAFVWADRRCEQSADQDKALVYAQNTAELVRHYCGDLQAAAAQTGGSVAQNRWTIGYDGFTATAQLQQSPTPMLGEAVVTVSGDSGKVLVRLTVCWQEVAP